MASKEYFCQALDKFCDKKRQGRCGSQGNEVEHLFRVWRPCSTGKTHVHEKAIQEAFARHEGVVVVSTPDEFSVKATYSTESEKKHFAISEGTLHIWNT